MRDSAAIADPAIWETRLLPTPAEDYDRADRWQFRPESPSASHKIKWDVEPHGGIKMTRPTSAELVEADGTVIPDLIAPGLRLLLVGINPGRHSGATGFHFGNPANRLWPALHQSGLTPRQFHPSDAQELLSLGIGITNLVDKTTQGAKDLKPADIRAGVDKLRLKVVAFRPRTVAVLGKSAFETGFDRPGATLGRQADSLEGSQLWLLPNPSPINQRYPLPDLVLRFRELRAAIDADG